MKRSRHKKYAPTKAPVWFTGLPCSGKTVLAKRLKEEFGRMGHRTMHLDGDVVRSGLNKDLGFSEKDRHENLRRVAHVARLFSEEGNLVIASFISPTNKMRSMIREIIGDIYLIYLKCGVETCEKRDTKGMYKKARLGEIENFTGVSAPFEEPENPDLVIDTENNDVATCVRQILQEIGK